MSRVLIPATTTWYDELKAVGYYLEQHLEREIQQHVRSLFPDFHVFPFKSRVRSRRTGQVNKPDMAMVQRDLRSWGVSEVELSDKDTRHVLNQTRCFLEGDYNAPKIAKYMWGQMKEYCRGIPTLTQLERLLQRESPKVIVIADAHVDAWREELRA